MRVQVQLFAGAAELAGCRSVELTFAQEKNVTIADVKERLCETHPALASLLQRSWCALQEEYVTPETSIQDGAVIAIIPPVSGGLNTAADLMLVRTPLLPSEMHERMNTTSAGAVVVFAGTVREFTHGRQTLRLEYEAYDAMALAKLRKVETLCRERWPIERMAIWHRLGTLELADISVLIGVATPHRHDAFAACEYAIQTLKQIVPIWKKEYFSDGTSKWMGPTDPWQPLS